MLPVMETICQMQHFSISFESENGHLVSFTAVSETPVDENKIVVAFA
jgi:hypothetical protein